MQAPNHPINTLDTGIAPNPTYNRRAKAHQHIDEHKPRPHSQQAPHMDPSPQHGHPRGAQRRGQANPTPHTVMAAENLGPHQPRQKVRGRQPHGLRAEIDKSDKRSTGAPMMVYSVGAAKAAGTHLSARPATHAGLPYIPRAPQPWTPIHGPPANAARCRINHPTQTTAHIQPRQARRRAPPRKCARRSLDERMDLAVQQQCRPRVAGGQLRPRPTGKDPPRKVRAVRSIK